MESIWGPTGDFHVYIKPIDRGGKRETGLINGLSNLGNHS